MCKRGSSPQTGANKHRLFWENLSSSAPLPAQTELVLLLGSFKLIILRHNLGLGFTLLKKGGWRKEKKKCFLVIFISVAFLHSWPDSEQS